MDVKKNSNNVGFKDKYEINELKLPNKSGIYLLYTDGLSEHFDKSFEGEIEKILKLPYLKYSTFTPLHHF